MKKTVITSIAIVFTLFWGQAQNVSKKNSNIPAEKLQIKINDNANPDLYVDGKKFDFPADLINPDKIESVHVLKGEKAMKEYNSTNGVILITTKKNELKGSPVKTIAHEDKPLVIIDGKRTDRSQLENLSPDDIESINIYKDDNEITKQYNAPQGVIMVTTKKEASRDKKSTKD